MSALYLSRWEWGASQATEDWIRMRVSDPEWEKVSLHIHHTAAIDDDDTPNRWGLQDAIRYMRKLQWSRPDLGPLPYNRNYAVLEDLTVVRFEARGDLKRGAHTANHNRTGMGWGVLGNFDKGDLPAAKALVAAMELDAQDLISNQGYTSLGSKPNPRGWPVWGHRDSSTKTCPGHTLYPLLEHFDLKGGDMAILTDEEQLQLRQFLNELKRIDSNVTFPRFVIPWYRKWSRFLPEHFDAQVTMDEIARRLTQE